MKHLNWPINTVIRLIQTICQQPRVQIDVKLFTAIYLLITLPKVYWRTKNWSKDEDRVELNTFTINNTYFEIYADRVTIADSIYINIQIIETKKME